MRILPSEGHSIVYMAAAPQQMPVARGNARGMLWLQLDAWSFLPPNGNRDMAQQDFIMELPRLHICKMSSFDFMKHCAQSKTTTTQRWYLKLLDSRPTLSNAQLPSARNNAISFHF